MDRIEKLKKIAVDLAEIALELEELLSLHPSSGGRVLAERCLELADDNLLTLVREQPKGRD